MKKMSNYLVGVVFVVFLIMVYPAETGTTSIVSNSSPYIEVCSRGIVYLPSGTRFVTCQGKVMEVIAVVPLGEGAKMASGCQCPLCCAGVCTVIVRCTGSPEATSDASDCLSENDSSSGGGLCTAYLAC